MANSGPSKGKPPRPPTILSEFSWTESALRRIRVQASTVIFAQGDVCDSLMFVEMGAVRLSVVSRAGKEGVIAIVEPGDFFGEGCLAGQPIRTATATAMHACSILRMEKAETLRQLRAQPAFFDRFLIHVLARNIRLQEDIVDQLFNSSERRLARALLLLAHYEGETAPRRLPRVSQELLAEMVGTTRPRINHFMNKFRELGYIEYDNDELTIHDALLTVMTRN